MNYNKESSDSLALLCVRRGLIGRTADTLFVLETYLLYSFYAVLMYTGAQVRHTSIRTTETIWTSQRPYRASEKGSSVDTYVIRNVGNGCATREMDASMYMSADTV